jgi:DNA (cytosine-5)-methyltransferase 1
MRAPGLIVDLFAGGGGASTGIEAALGRTVDIAINHSAIALKVHEANHPGTRHLTADIWEVKPQEATEGRPVDLLWASPDCTHFSVAKGGKPRKQNIRSLSWAVVRWAADVRPAVIALENVADGRPVFFETMVFGGEFDHRFWRYPTREAAIKGHADVVAMVRTAMRGQE